MPLIEHIISLIAPHRCLACRAEGLLLCAPCVTALEPAADRCFSCLSSTTDGRTCADCGRLKNLYAARSIAAYRDVAKDIIRVLKFERSVAAARVVAHIMVPVVPSAVQLITYVPAATNRVRARGYDQAKLLARHISRSTGVPYTPLLARSRNTRQVGASGEQRRNQQNTAFRPINTHILHNQHILIIDDVITTGATLEACAGLLLKNGAQRVSALTFAQA